MSENRYLDSNSFDVSGGTPTNESEKFKNELANTIAKKCDYNEKIYKKEPEAEDDTTGNTGDANFDTKASAGIQL